MVQSSFKIEANKLVFTKDNSNLSSKIKYDSLLNNTRLIKNSKRHETPNNTFNIQNRRYLGNKFKLTEFTYRVIQNNCNNVKSIADIFA